MIKERRPRIIGITLLTILVISSVAVLIRLRTEDAWLKPIPPYTVFVARMEGASHESREFQEMTDVMAIVFTSQNAFLPSDHTMNSHSWPRQCAWYQILGHPNKGADLGVELPRLQKMLNNEITRRGICSPWKLALVYPDGKVVQAQ
jgi:hypothetical protein